MPSLFVVLLHCHSVVDVILQFHLAHAPFTYFVHTHEWVGCLKEEMQDRLQQRKETGEIQMLKNHNKIQGSRNRYAGKAKAKQGTRDSMARIEVKCRGWNRRHAGSCRHQTRVVYGSREDMQEGTVRRTGERRASRAKVVFNATTSSVRWAADAGGDRGR